ncbi:hypothetical protein FJD38_09330 [Pseudomonas saxonica]|uniref:Uncharacterized protein n=1 Tax=Pseudomonas saxonica TaxID=2600598 RepID=A0A5C5PXR2_9PSED|nr:hypothetical protein [Pseudomonas saxonica]TWR91255.1 hypothetical protein FJD38_09330 [Pseudomonas saxonica]TWR94233.1 hypothetical protein FJD37_11955 [Pseudomonas saxonica]
MHKRSCKHVLRQVLVRAELQSLDAPRLHPRGDSLPGITPKYVPPMHWLDQIALAWRFSQHKKTAFNVKAALGLLHCYQ